MKPDKIHLTDAEMEGLATGGVYMPAHQSEPPYTKTLRDEFAMAAMAGFVYEAQSKDIVNVEIAAMSFALADAMLAARESK